MDDEFLGIDKGIWEALVGAIIAIVAVFFGVRLLMGINAALGWIAIAVLIVFFVWLFSGKRRESKEKKKRKALESKEKVDALEVEEVSINDWNDEDVAAARKVISTAVWHDRGVLEVFNSLLDGVDVNDNKENFILLLQVQSDAFDHVDALIENIPDNRLSELTGEIEAYENGKIEYWKSVSPYLDAARAMTPGAE